MASVEQQVRSIDEVIAQNVSTMADNRGLLSQNVLAQLRNLVEALIVWSHRGDGAEQFHFLHVTPALETVRAQAKFRVLTRLHDLLQASTSHYTLDPDPSERLMLKYYPFLLRIRALARDEFGIAILAALESFPLDLDPSLREYHEQIARQVQAPGSASNRRRPQRYYIHSSRPFVVASRVYYEVSFSLAHSWTRKADHMIAFTDLDITDRYAAQLELSSETISVLGHVMPIVVIRSWEVSIRPCELNNYARLLGHQANARSRDPEYRNLMQYLTHTRSSLLDLVDMSDVGYNRFRQDILAETNQPAQFLPALDDARAAIRDNRPVALSVGLDRDCS